MIPTLASSPLGDALRAARETRFLEIGEGLLTETPAILRDVLGNRAVALVADERTFAAAGRVVQGAFQAAGSRAVGPFLFPGRRVEADAERLLDLEAALRRHEAIPMAVGSGTINDLTKLAAHRVGRPYVCVATAASMDGYAAFGASITSCGSKQTFPCPAPLAIVADLDVIRAAPAAMNAWGYADLLAKVVAGADWILADALGIEPVDAGAWATVQGRLREAVGDPAGVRAGHPEAMARLVEGLMLSGFAMQKIQSSRPASGAEHQFSHLWDMEHHVHQGDAPAHGLKVGIGTLVSTALYERLLAMSPDTLDIDACCAAWPGDAAWRDRARQEFGAGDLGAVAVREVSAKHIAAEPMRAQLERLRVIWPDLVRRLRAQLLSFPMLRDWLRAAGAATEPEEIGITRERLRASCWRAWFIRRRFTVLDLAVRSGWLDACLDALFGPDGPWPVFSQGPAPNPSRP
ncbi:MAG TPA: sn-glycerol-1-phosphate dehydrogenase [Verrucomicrobiota bacterium]|nr:sn-glycerol-1-phosphate dehydrogenase [Verrucomicrobiota bacterium]HNU52218.1 sn-glycerol-1-phosphate dehydrogenase [Verrucomicrobiota bacterium]